jgi:hypothetical protein
MRKEYRKERQIEKTRLGHFPPLSPQPSTTTSPSQPILARLSLSGCVRSVSLAKWDRVASLLARVHACSVSLQCGPIASALPSTSRHRTCRADSAGGARA